MVSSREERKARLVNHAEAVIDRSLDSSETTPEPNLNQIEALVQKLRKTLGEQIGDCVKSKDNVTEWTSFYQKIMSLRGRRSVKR